MADRKAINKYYPPDWDPSKGSVNKYQKSHPLRDRARKIDQGILVVRFEMPFNVWCLKCNNHVGMGVRYNAEKSKVGNYYTTPVYQFKMKCHLCDNYFVIRTDPAKFDYSIDEGARRQAEQTIDVKAEEVRAGSMNQDAGPSRLLLQTAEEAKLRITDSMLKLEKRVEDRMKSDANQPSLHDLKKWRDLREDSFSMNQLVRSQYRKRRKEAEKSKERDKKLLKKTSLKITLVEPASCDRRQAKKILSDKKKADLERSRKIYLSGSKY
uniref:Coiled-coil domain-containing protein 130 n=1 Tax=Aceria tosichella TaxID=561515 RepID=A0A6G1S5J5_9ACAR